MPPKVTYIVGAASWWTIQAIQQAIQAIQAPLYRLYRQSIQSIQAVYTGYTGSYTGYTGYTGTCIITHIITPRASIQAIQPGLWSLLKLYSNN